MLETLLPQLAAFGQVILIDLVLSGDNAIVVGIAAQGVAPAARRNVIIFGVGAAVVLRILFATIAVYLLGIVGLTFAGGLLLFWVCWKLWVELRGRDDEAAHHEAGSEGAANAGTTSLRAAITSIILADVSMSLDNVLAVAGASREHVWVMVFGLVLSVALMGLAASVIARIMNRFPWIAYVGLAVIVYVAAEMTWDGGLEVLEALKVAH